MPGASAFDELAIIFFIVPLSVGILTKSVEAFGDKHFARAIFLAVFVFTLAKLSVLRIANNGGAPTLFTGDNIWIKRLLDEDLLFFVQYGIMATSWFMDAYGVTLVNGIKLKLLHLSENEILKKNGGAAPAPPQKGERHE